MTLLIGQTLVKDVEAVSELTRQAIAFIDGGSEWLRWGLHGNKVRGSFPDESQMTGAIQVGLHGTPFTFLRSLKLPVSPIKLMTFSLDDLRLTAEVEVDPSNARRRERVMRIFDNHRLLVADQLAAGTAWLNAFKLDDAALFQVMNFHEQAAIADLAAWVREHPVAKALSLDAARFAAAESRAPLEFVDFYRAYIAVAEKLHTHGHTADVRTAALSAVHQLSHLAFHALDCPQTQPLSGPDAVALAVELWAASGRPLGFARVSACVREIILHTRFVSDERWHKDREAWAKDRFEAYLETSLTLARRAKLSHPRMGQDGATCHYTLAAGDYIAGLQMDPAGIITISSLQEIAPIEAVIDPFGPVTANTRTSWDDQEEDTAQ